jgi:hypothetical protein
MLITGEMKLQYPGRAGAHGYNPSVVQSQQKVLQFDIRNIAVDIKVQSWNG